MSDLSPLCAPKRTVRRPLKMGSRPLVKTMIVIAKPPKMSEPEIDALLTVEVAKVH
jgi:hypothetical protein